MDQASLTHRFQTTLIIFCALAAAPSIAWIANTWTNNVLTGGVLGIFVPIAALSLFALAPRRKISKESDFVQRTPSYTLLTAALVLVFGSHLFAFFAPQAIIVSALAIPLLVLGLLHAHGQPGYAFPCFFLYGAFPFELYLRQTFEPTLQALTAQTSQTLLNLAGFGIQLYGPHTIYTERFYVIVDQTCSGINLIITLTLYTSVFSWLVLSKYLDRAIILCFTPVLAIFQNGVRVAVIYLMGHFGGLKLAMGSWHTWSAYLVFLPMFAFLALFARALESRRNR